ncbi:hypothetical protein VDG1235_3400 [Verrucomicrobiia bacterium DG1235]|nr:hypothetical protein VDG1235_3400 [Verrucomicrobiae bacterium DG1235]
MKRIIASIGLVFLAAQIALGSVGAIFLCLCVGHEEHASPCAPAIVDTSESAACLHDEPVASTVEKPADEACDDLLFTGNELEPVDRLGDSLKLKAGTALTAFAFSDHCGQLPPLSELQPQAARSPPQQTPCCTVYTRTIKLLI